VPLPDDVPLLRDEWSDERGPDAPRAVILGIDQGTTGTTCLILDERARVTGRAYREHRQHFPRPGWVEHDPEEIWESVQATARAALADAGLDPGALEAIGITNQRETALAWDRDSGEPLARAVVWQDRRTAERCDELREQGHEQLLRERTGLVLDSYFSATKWEWLLTEGGVEPERAALGTMDAWLVHKLCGRHATDHSNASRTLLFDIRERRFDPDLCELLSIPLEALPEPLPSSHVVGETEVLGGGRAVPVAGVAGDQQAALFGQGCHAAGQGKNTYGTGSFVLQNTGPEPAPLAHGLLSTLAWTLGGERTDYAVEASIFVTGAAVQWLRDGLGIIAEATETEGLARSLDSNDGVYFVPALTGLASPHWDPYARGTIVGLTRGNHRAHLARAALEAIAYQTVDAVRAMEDASGEGLDELRADGGAVENAWLMQFQADVLGVPVSVPEVVETTALGAAALAGVAVGTWTEEDVRALWREAACYEPSMSGDERETLLAGWHAALDRARG
jgi:glycerol kinase